MAAAPPGGSGSGAPAGVGGLVQSLSSRGPQAPAQPPWMTNGTYGRVCTMGTPPNQQYLSQGETREQEAARRARERRQMNTIGLWFGGVATGGGAAVRLLGGSEDAVEAAAKAGWEVFSETNVPGAGGH